MISLKLALLAIALHFIGDFVLQSRWMGENKSKNWLALLAHVGVYTACLTPLGFRYALLNGGIHFVVDAATSRVTSRMWEKKNVYGFFTVIGLDQMIHAMTLLSTLLIR